VKAGETQVLDSTRQKECPISKFVQENVQDVMSGALNAGKTVTVRAVSDCEHHFAVPNPIRRYYRMADGPSSDPVLAPIFRSCSGAHVGQIMSTKGN
jgi:hypothetical protein